MQWTLALGLASSQMVAIASAGEAQDVLGVSVDDASGPSWLLGNWAPTILTENALLWSDGITLMESRLGARWKSDGFENGFGVTYRGYELDYEPEVFGKDVLLSEDQLAFAWDGRWKVNAEWSILGTANYYDGFGDYRSLWISEYYEQLFGETPFYSPPSPRGYSASLGLEWDYIPVMARVRLTGGYGRDTIAPSYDVLESGPERARANLYTSFVQLQTENVLTKRLVVQNVLQYTDTTNRDARWSLRSSWNVALAEQLYLRLQGGGAVEAPQFDAYFLGMALEYQLLEQWFLRINARFYKDSGEIENSLGGFTSAAPELESFELGLGLRWQGYTSALNFYVGYYDTEYAPLAEDNAFLKNLYADRRWGVAQLSFTHRF